MHGLQDIDFMQVPVMGDALLAELDRVREATPIMWSDTLQSWLVTRHADVMDGLSGNLPLSNVRFAERCFDSIPKDEIMDRIPIVARSTPSWIVNVDPPQHTRLRKLMAKAFGRRVVEDLRPFARATIDRVLNEAAARGEVEFVDEVARAITGRVIMKMLGVPETHLPSLKKWSFDLNTAFGSARPPAEALENAEETLRQMTELFRGEIAKRREQPSEDFLSQLVQARDGADMLTDEELMGICYVTLVSGHDTTMNSMALGLRALIRNPEAVRYLLDHPEESVGCVMEIARYSSMSTAQPRIVSADFEWCGQQLRKGDTLFLAIAAANRDPRVFDDPNELRLGRPAEEIAVFGPGLHHCIGHLLAKMQLGEFFPAYFRRFERTEIVNEPLLFVPSISFRGVEEMRLRLTPSHELAAAE